MYFFSSAGLIACKDVGFFEAFSCLWTPSPTFYKLGHPFNAGHPAPSITCREGLTTLPWHGQLVAL